MNIPNFYLYPNLYSPGINYENYTVNVTTIMDDYYDLQIFKNISVISFTRFLDRSIVFHEAADLIVFKGDNYISDVEIADTLYSGSIGYINVSSFQAGNLTIEISDENETIIHENELFSTGYTELIWNIDSDLMAGQYYIVIPDPSLLRTSDGI